MDPNTHSSKLENVLVTYLIKKGIVANIHVHNRSRKLTNSKLKVHTTRKANAHDSTSKLKLMQPSFFFLFCFTCSLSIFSTMMSFESDQQKCESLSLFVFFCTLACERICIKMNSTKSKFVTGQENLLFTCIFQPGNLTGWGNKRIKDGSNADDYIDWHYIRLVIAPGPTVHWLFRSHDLPSKYRYNVPQ